MEIDVLEKAVQVDGLCEYTSWLNRRCREFQEFDEEKIPSEKAYEAYAIIKNMQIKEVGDVLLFCASMNLLNTYVKQKDSKIGYKFKNEIHYMTSILLALDIADICIDYQESGNLLMVQVFAIQFSFHFVKKDLAIIKLCDSDRHKPLRWDGIRKQKCALTLFEHVRKNQIGTCGITYRGKPLDAKISKMVKGYVEGKVTFEGLIKE